jgi:tripartite-type tricarboxylate transporter receptor subunit TctC
MAVQGRDYDTGFADDQSTTWITGIGVASRATMQLPRRTLLTSAAATLASATFPHFASAQEYPSRPVRIVAGFAAGGGVDVTARLIGQWLAERLGQSFVIENRTGAGGNVGTEAVVNAAADGYTLLLATVPNAVNASLYEKLNFNFIRDTAPVAGIIRVPMVMLLNPSVPATTVAEFIAYAKANPEKVNMASAGNGSAPHMAGELFKMMAGVDLVHVPYRGQGPALSDLLGGQVQVLFAATPGTTDYIATGKLRALAITTAARAKMLPELPTIADFVPGYEASQWYGISAPKNTPAEIVGKLNREINAGIADPAMKARFAAIGGEPLPGSPAEFGRLIAEESEKWAKVVRAAGIKPE